MTDRQGYGGQPQQGHGQQHGQGQPWQAGPSPTQPLYVPPGGPRGRKPWPARHKVLSGFLVFGALMLIAGIAEAGSSPSSSTPAAAVSLTAKPVAGTASPTAQKTTPTAAAAPTVTTAPAQTTPASPSTQAQTTAAHSAAPATPVHTTPAVPASTAPASCYPLSNEGTCYEPGEYCRKTDHGKSGVAGDGKSITCEDNDGWRWEPS